jgi:hypothetical protein
MMPWKEAARRFWKRSLRLMEQRNHWRDEQARRSSQLSVCRTLLDKWRKGDINITMLDKGLRGAINGD